MNTKRNARIVGNVVMLALCSACSTHLTPAMRTLETFPIGAFKPQPVTVINAQAATAEIEIGSSGTGMGQIPKTVYGNLHEWTEIACATLRKELQSRTSPTTATAAKEMRLAITQVAIEPITFLGGNTVNLHLTVTMGDGTTKDYTVEYTHPSKRDIEVNAGSAVVKAVATVLNDEVIRSYLQK